MRLNNVTVTEKLADELLLNFAVGCDAYNATVVNCSHPGNSCVESIMFEYARQVAIPHYSVYNHQSC